MERTSFTHHLPPWISTMTTTPLSMLWGLYWSREVHQAFHPTRESYIHVPFPLKEPTPPATVPLSAWSREPRQTDGTGICWATEEGVKHIFFQLAQIYIIVTYTPLIWCVNYGHYQVQSILGCFLSKRTVKYQAGPIHQAASAWGSGWTFPPGRSFGGDIPSSSAASHGAVDRGLPSAGTWRELPGRSEPLWMPTRLQSRESSWAMGCHGGTASGYRVV